MWGGALTTVNNLPNILILFVLHCKNKCTSVYLLRYCTGFCHCVTTRCVLVQFRKKIVHVIVSYKYIYHNKHQGHHQQWSCRPWQGGTCSLSFRRTWVIVAEKQSIMRSVKDCPSDFFLVPSLLWMGEPFSRQQDFISFHSFPSWLPSKLPGTHHRSNRPCRPLAILNLLKDACVWLLLDAIDMTG